MLNREFLANIAFERRLSQLQQDVFVKKFTDAYPGQIKSDAIVAEQLFLAKKTVSNCMSNVYRKFDLTGFGPNKANQLLGLLLRQQPRSEMQDTLLSESDRPSVLQEQGGSLQRSPLLKVRDEEIRQLRRKINKLPRVEAERKRRKASEQVHKKKRPTFQEKLEIAWKELNLPEIEVRLFFEGEPVSRETFVELAEALGQAWTQISDGDFADVVVHKIPAIRDSIYSDIKKQCGTLRILDVEYSIDIDELYVDVNILKKLTRHRRKAIAELSAVYNANTDKVDRSALSDVDQPRVSGEKAALENQKLMIFGKPGSGKTTFLKHIAIMCNEGEFQPYRVPVFIQLRTYIESVRSEGDYDLKKYIEKKLIATAHLKKDRVREIVDYGRLLILLDGLDEVPIDDASEVRSQINKIAQEWCKNRIVITCRIAAYEHTFLDFTEVEISDFDICQVENFARNWFLSRLGKTSGKDALKEFMSKIQAPEYEPVKEIAVTPILLTLTCLVFQEKEDFPENRYKLYEDGLDILIARWDKRRSIKRNNEGIYKQFSSQERMKLFSYIAATTFEKSEYFFERDKLRSLISLYVKEELSSNFNKFLKQEDENADGVINTIEVQHGLLVERAHDIFSFSHLTFQEYFTARKIAREPQAEISKRFINQITDKRCLEVFLLASEMLGQADNLLKARKKNIDNLLAGDGKIQRFLEWLSKKASFDKSKREALALRAFYFDCYVAFLGLQDKPEDTLSAAVSRPLARVFKETHSRRSVIDSDYALMRLLALLVKSRPPYSLDKADYSLILHYLKRAIELSPEENLKDRLSLLKVRIPEENEFPPWWKLKSSAWMKEFRHVLSQHRLLGYDWRFRKSQRELLMQYYSAHIGLVHRLDTQCAMSPTFRNELRETLLLPSQLHFPVGNRVTYETEF